ncbi:MAG: DUF2341 domain-containing protein, partial [Verrucomicrobiota bacterium]
SVSNLVITSIDITGPHAADFVVTTPLSSANLAFNEAATFTVTFTPGAAGVRTATISIPNNDPDEDPYDFIVVGQQGTDTDGDFNMHVRVCGYGGTNTLADFPVLVVLSTNIPGFSYDQFAYPTSGADLRVKDVLANQVLDHEIELWNTNGESYVWVKVPAMEANSSFDVSWGNATLPAQAPAYTTNGSVWSANYLGVWHLDETSGTQLDDASAGNNEGTADTGVNDLNVPGVIGTGADFAGTADTAEINLMNPIALFDAPWSVSFWARQVIDDVRGMILGDPSDDNSFVHLDGLNGRVRFRTTAGVDTDFGAQPSFAAGLEQYTLTSDGDNVSLYRQGALIGTMAVGDVSWNIDALGTGMDTGNTELNGRLDDVRVANAERNADWVLAAYRTIALNSQFLCYEEVAGPIQAEDYAVFGFAPNRVYDGQIASGNYSVSIELETPVGLLINPTQPNFDVANNAGLKIVNDDVFTNNTVINNGFGLLAQNNSVSPVAPANIDLGTYRIFWTAEDLNGETVIDGQLSPPQPFFLMTERDASDGPANVINTLDDALNLLDFGTPQVIQEAQIFVQDIHFIDNIGDNHGQRFPMGIRTFPAGGDNSTAGRVTGEFYIPQDGVYTFGVHVDDGSKVTIDGIDVLIDAPIHSGATRYFSVFLAEGLHDLDAVWFNDPGDSVWELFVANDLGSYSAFAGAGSPPGGWSLLESPGFVTNLDLSMSFVVEDDDVNPPVAGG